MEKRDIALTQLRAAAKCYNSEDYVSCVTLAGAAEEILGQIAKKRTGINQLDNETNYLIGVYQTLTGQVLSDKDARQRINKTKNELKHNDNGENSWRNTDFENEAALLFVKAVKNYYSSYNKLPADRIIKTLFEQLTL